MKKLNPLHAQCAITVAIRKEVLKHISIQFMKERSCSAQYVRGIIVEKVFYAYICNQFMQTRGHSNAQCVITIVLKKVA